MMIHIPPMPALTIYQPWASLIACGAKPFETRSWATNYRGPIAIHAGMSNDFYKTEVNTEEMYKFITAAQKALDCPGLHTLPRGCIIATAELVGCWRIFDGKSVGIDHPCIDQPNQWREIWGNELLFGDWTPCRYAWELRNVQLLAEPIPAKGQQGLWNWGDVA